MTDSPRDLAEQATAVPEPSRRHLRVFAFDPMVARLPGTEAITLSVPYEPLRPGPSGELVQVIDYDGAQGCYYEPVDLDDRRLLLQDGLPPSERDPRFHQQMVYAIVSTVLENFEHGLGRRFSWRGTERLKIFPHAFVGPNARFVPDMGGTLQFGYFKADAKNPGRNLPGQQVFSCLSHDIIAHETTHALVHRQRQRFKEPTNLDVPAFHEGFADLVALFQHFTLPEVVERHIQHNRTDLGENSPLVDLAQQFGEGSGMGRALRSALGEPPDPMKLGRTFQAHRRGAILVAATFDGYLSTYQQRIADLLRIATAGTGVLPQGALHPDLVRRVGAEARRTAQRYLGMCIRAFQYLPPVDVTFGDFLRSLVTADRELYPEDRDGLRARLIEGFRQRGIYPSEVASLADESIMWPDASGRSLPPLDHDIVDPLVLDTATGFRQHGGPASDGSSTRARPVVYGRLRSYAQRHWRALDLAPDTAIDVDGFHALFRVGADGRARVEVVVRFVQTADAELQARLRPRLGGLPLRGGTTIVADATGRIKFVISKPLPASAGSDDVTARGADRLRGILEFVDTFDGYAGATMPWRADPSRVVDELNVANLDTAG
ncbi:hypothetical protein ACQP0C_22200 [Nocardia sp. CA-129566]|uniref:hypothetical protein n=1 Tax=Nocardia sp. CA-129566 TaxID=3239976 RepID=UPI003D95431E